jgi:hypothetical protein
MILVFCAVHVILWAQHKKADKISGTNTAHRESKKQVVRESKAKQPIGD